MSSIRVLYVGSGLSGRSTSLTGLLYGQVRPEVSVAACVGSRSTGFTRLEREPLQQFDVYCAVSTARSFFYYDDPSDSDVDERVRCEIEALRTIDGLVIAVDCRVERHEAAAEALDLLRRDLERVGRNLDHVPKVFQLTFLDWPGAQVPTEIAKIAATASDAVFRTHPPSMSGTLDPLLAVVRQIVESRTPS